MAKIEKFRKLCKAFQWVSIGFVAIAAFAMIIIQNYVKTTDNNFFLYSIAIIMVVFMVITFASIPLQSHLLKLVILESLNGIVTDVTFDRKKGYSKDSFSKLNLAPANFAQYGCSDYFSFKYHDMVIESTTIKAYDEFKIPKSVDATGKVVKAHKANKVYFQGRIYIIPLKAGVSFNVYGKSNPSLSRVKEMVNSDYSNNVNLKVKKQYENFEVFIKEEKPTFNVQKFLDRLLTLKLQAKGPVHCFVRENCMVLLIDNNRMYEEIDIKKPVDENIIRGYKRDVAMVLGFINTISTPANEFIEEIKE